MARLKTYTAEIDGLHEWIVAAPNQTAALDAFGVNQNLFAQGEASVATDPELAKAAEAKPGIPLRRMKGSSEPFKPVSTGADWSSALSAATAKAPKTKVVSRRALDEAEAALARFDEEGAAEIETLEAERAAIARRLDQARAAFEQKRGELAKKVDKAADAYHAKGGV